MTDPGKSLFSENECEFLAEDELVTITPLFSCAPIVLMTSEYGPFKTNMPINIPLWFALDLKRKNKCKIHPPDWMREDVLEETFQLERSEGAFSPLPFHFVEISTLLLHHSRDSFPEPQRIQSKIAEIRRLRESKITMGLKQVQEDQIVKLTNISAMELCTNRQFLLGTLDTFRQLSRRSVEAAARAALAEAAGGSDPHHAQQSVPDAPLPTMVPLLPSSEPAAPPPPPPMPTEAAQRRLRRFEN